MTKQALIQGHNEKVREMLRNERDKKIFITLMVLVIGFIAIHFVIYLFNVHHGNIPSGF
jgi:t-SNARE complex subunit (syntaxin)